VEFKAIKKLAQQLKQAHTSPAFIATSCLQNLTSLISAETTSNLTEHHSGKIKNPLTSWPYSSHHPFQGFPLNKLFGKTKST